MRERFTVVELNALRSDLLQGGLIDSREAAELLQVFLMGRGYGVSPQAAFDAAGRVEMSGSRAVAVQTEAGERITADVVVLNPDLPLARRLIEALAAGEAAGGEFVPVISAALLVAHQESFPYVDLRVDSHASPIIELDRLWRAYEPEAALYVTRANDPAAAPPP